MTQANRIFSALVGVVALFGVATAQSPSPAGVAPPAPEVSRLRQELRELLRAPGWGESGYGVLVTSLDRGDTLFSVQPDLPLAPASNAKLYSTAAALYFLGPDYRFSTYVLADGPIRDGVLEGDLILYGTGDPAISGRMIEGPTAALRVLVDSLRRHGVREIRGAVVGDGSYFDAEWTGPGWNPNDLDTWYGAPVGALSIAENLVSLRFLPGPPGEPARIRTTPATIGLAVENRVRTVAGGSSSVRIERAADRLIATGQIARRHAGITRTLPVVDPANFAASALRAALEEGGIEVRGGVRTVSDAARSRVTLGGAPRDASGAPPPRVLAVHLSPRLDAIAAVTNHISHNLFADALLKMVGRVAFGEGSFAAGRRAVQHLLEREASVDSSTVRLVDGSGLSRINRVTARTTIHLLDFMARSDLSGDYVETLPQAGSLLGLRRMQGTAAAGNLRAKTGTIRNVSSLSGYVRAANGEQLAFSIIANGVPSTARAKRTEDAIGARLARFMRPPARNGAAAGGSAGEHPAGADEESP